MLIRPARLVVAFLITTAGLSGLGAQSASAAVACANAASMDFNGDGYSDAVVSDVHGSAGSVLDAGRVVILYGSSMGPATGGVAVLTQASIGGTPTGGELFGTSPVVEDLNADGCADLLVGSPGEKIAGHPRAGAMQVISGAPGGLNATGDNYTLTAPNFARAVDTGAAFGSSIAVGRDADGGKVVAVGAPGARVGGRAGAGWVGVYIPFSQLVTSFDQNSKGIPGGAETGDAFGRAVAFSYLTGMLGTPDLVVGSPGEDSSGKTDNGTITVIPDPFFADAPAAKSYGQDTKGVPGAAESGDEFGASLAAGDSHGTAFLAVGVPGEGIGKAEHAGAIQLFSSDGLKLHVRNALSQNTAGIGGTAETGDRFGETLSYGTGQAVTDFWLVVGIPHESSALRETGAVQLFPMLAPLTGDRTYTQNSTGVPGTAEAFDHFGSAVGFIGDRGKSALLVGVPDDSEFSSGIVDVIPFNGATPTAWRPGAAGIPATGFASFGSGLGQ